MATTCSFPPIACSRPMMRPRKVACSLLNRAILPGNSDTAGTVFEMISTDVFLKNVSF